MGESLRTNDSITQAVTKYADMLVRVCFTYMKNIHDAEEIAQEAFIRLIEKQPSFQSDEHQKAWLLRVAINLCKNRLKSPWLRRTQTLEGSDLPSFTPEESEVLSAVQQLPLRYRSVIHLYYYEGYKVSEISTLLGNKESTIASWLHRGRGILKTKLKEDYDE
jgi:RNA polymerase sigma-70 factor (ECF subfamily)